MLLFEAFETFLLLGSQDGRDLAFGIGDKASKLRRELVAEDFSGRLVFPPFFKEFLHRAGQQIITGLVFGELRWQ